jgi:hypothetical protein
MILYQSSLIDLDFDPVTDILFVKWPDTKSMSTPELARTLEILSDNLRYYDVKRILLDASHTTLEVTDPKYKETMVQFFNDVLHTRLQKFARLMTTDKFRENLLHELTNPARFTIPFQSFSSKAEALEWLQED